MTDDERQQVETALGIVNLAVDHWSPDDSPGALPPGQQWRQMLSAWGIVSGIVQQTMQPPQQQPMPPQMSTPQGNGLQAVESEPEPVDG